MEERRKHVRSMDFIKRAKSYPDCGERWIVGKVDCTHKRYLFIRKKRRGVSLRGVNVSYL